MRHRCDLLSPTGEYPEVNGVQELPRSIPIMVLPGHHVVRTYSRKELVFQPGAHRDEIYFLEEGKVRLFMMDPSGRECTIGVLVPGDMFSGHTRCYGEALCTVKVAVTDVKTFARLMEEDPETCRRTVAVLGRCLKNAFDIIEGLVFKACSSRLAWMLLEAAETRGEPGPAGITLTMDLTTEQLASRIGTTRQTLSTLLNEWERSGLLRRRKREWILRDPQRLRELSRSSGEVDD